MSELLVAGMAYLDVHVGRTPPVPAGTEVFVDAISLSLGGAANSASVAAALGVDVALCVPAGDGIADLALRRLAGRLGIALLPLAAQDDPAVTLVMAGEADRAFVSAACFDVLDQVSTLAEADWILVPGLEEAARLAGPLARARRAGSRIAVSASWNPRRLADLAQHEGPAWDLLVLNEKEAAVACGDPYDAPQLLAGMAHSVVVTMGAAGAYGIIDGDTVTAEAPRVAVLDTTGAGDAFCAGLLAALIGGQRPAEALAFGATAAAHIVQQRGGTLQDPARIAALAKEIPWKH